jgi:hypothetical protein
MMRCEEVRSERVEEEVYWLLVVSGAGRSVALCGGWWVVDEESKGI